MRWCQLSDRFLLPQYKQGHAFSGHAAPHGPGAAREVGREGGREGVREGGAGGASRYPAQGGAKGGGGINGSNSRSSQTCCSEGFPAVQVGTPQSMLLMTPLA